MSGSIAGGQVSRPRIDAEDRWSVHSLNELRANPPKPMSWLVEGLIPARGLCIVYGAPNVGKTWLALDLALSVQAGAPFATAATTQTDVLYLDSENGLGAITQRAQALRVTADISVCDAIGTTPLAASELPSFEDAILQRGDYGLVVVDSLRQLWDGDETSVQDTAQLTRNLRRLTNDHDLALLVLHHNTKTKQTGDTYAGCNHLLGGVDTMYELSNSPPTLRCIRNRHTHSQSIDLTNTKYGTCPAVPSSPSPLRGGGEKAHQARRRSA